MLTVQAVSWIYARQWMHECSL